MTSVFEQLFLRLGLGEVMASRLSVLSAIAVLLVLAMLMDLIARVLLKTIIQKSVRKTKAKWDDILFDSGVFDRFVRLVPYIIVLAVFPLLFPLASVAAAFVRRCLVALIVLMVIHAAASCLDAFNEIYKMRSPEMARRKPVKVYLQTIKIAAYVVGIILAVTSILNVSPVGVLSGFGAMSAVLLLVFKDAIVGFVSSMQLSANDMVRLGDWIEMPKYGADGDVIDITLQSIKVRNWDMTITTIPIYALVSDSFKNWRGMSESNGRRITRSIAIDMQSVRFLTEIEKQTFSRFRLLREYMAKKEEEIYEHNSNLGVAGNDHVSGRSLTNLGTYRAYISAYLDDHPMVEKSMIHMVRYLESTPEGLPLQLYLFCVDKAWVNYEAVQADIMDHLLAVMGEFGLRVYQQASGWDIQAIAEALREDDTGAKI